MTSILLIEDDPIMGESLMQRFELEGLQVSWCRRLAEAREALATLPSAVAMNSLAVQRPSSEEGAGETEEAGSACTACAACAPAFLAAGATAECVCPAAASNCAAACADW